MALVISGNAAHVTTPLVATIVGMANNGSGDIRVQTSAAHLFASDDYVHVVTITTVIDAYFVITVIDATHFDLVGSTYTGTGTGTATDASLTPQIQVPTDGDTASLQLSGMLSALQALADRTQALAKSSVRRSVHTALVTASGQVVVPPWAGSMLLLGWGGGGGGGGGMGGILGVAGSQHASGGGGGGAKLGVAMRSMFGATRLDVVCGTGGAGGAGSAGSATPASATDGSDGNATTVTYTDGTFPAALVAKFRAGAPGAGGTNHVVGAASSTPIYTPGGGGGPAAFNRGGGRRSHTSPGPRQLYDITNTAGTLTAFPVAWPANVYTDPIGQRAFGDGGASMATAGNPTYAAGLSYSGAPSEGGFADGGAAGTEGATGGGGHCPGAAGGGGGAGPFGPAAGGASGGAGGNGGAGVTGAPGANGTAGGAGYATSGGGGGGGGGGGCSNSGSAGNGAAGGAGGAGAVWIVFFPANV